MVKTITDFSITASSQTTLLSLARKAIEEYLNNNEVIDFTVDTNNELIQLAAVFVTLTRNCSLRGCIGTIEPEYHLCEAVIRMSLAAAFNDSRFLPLTKDELPETSIEISVISPMVKISSADEIVEGRHGVLLQKNGHSGLFLPQVWEYFNSKEDFMNELCSQKAGLSQDAWKNHDAELFIFTVFSFDDNKYIIS